MTGFAVPANTHTMSPLQRNTPTYTETFVKWISAPAGCLNQLLLHDMLFYARFDFLQGTKLITVTYEYTKNFTIVSDLRILQ